MSKRQSKKSPAKKGRGGARPGAGRPRKVVSLEDFSNTPPPPEDPLKRAIWAQGILAMDLYRIVMGKADRGFSQELRAGARAMATLMPYERLAEAEDAIKQSEEARSSKKQAGATVENVETVAAAPLARQDP